MPRAFRLSLASALLAATARTLAAQAGQLPPSPTLPSDTLQANYGPRGEAVPAPSPELSPTLPSDTLQATQPGDSLGDSSSSRVPGSDDLLPDAAPQTPGDSAALRELKSWIQRHPGLLGPPPVRAVLVRV